jgi:hypothetical protein
MSQSKTATQCPGSSAFGSEPGHQLLGQRKVARPRALVAACPALDLTLHESHRVAAERLETDLHRIDRVKIRQHVDDDFRHLPVCDRIGATAVAVRHDSAHDDPGATLHDEEGRPDHRLVVAIRVRARGGREALPQDGQRPVLALHVVRAGRHRPERRAPQDVLPPGCAGPEPQQVGQVRVAAGELGHLERVLGALDASREPGLEGLGVEALVGANRNHIGGGCGHGAAGYQPPEASTGESRRDP